MGEATALYRFFDATDQLLYVGITNNTETRWAKHTRKPWWDDVASRAVEWHATREDALLAEAIAITSEDPRWNIALPNQTDPLRSAGGAKSTGRPVTGQKSVRSFRPPDALWDEFLAVMAKDGRSHSDALIEALRDWVRKQQGDKAAGPDG